MFLFINSQQNAAVSFIQCLLQVVQDLLNTHRNFQEECNAACQPGRLSIQTYKIIDIWMPIVIVKHKTRDKY